MQGRVFLFNFAGVPVFAHPGYLVLVAFAFGAHADWPGAHAWALGFILALGLTFSLVAHELGHVAMGRAYGLEPLAIELNGFGGLTYLSGKRATSWGGALVLLTGPMVNLWLCAVAQGGLAIMAVLDGEAAIPAGLWQAASDFSDVNGVLFAVNALPALPLDGGRALRRVAGDDAPAVASIFIGTALLILAPRYGVWCFYVAMLVMLQNLRRPQKAC